MCMVNKKLLQANASLCSFLALPAEPIILDYCHSSLIISSQAQQHDATCQSSHLLSAGRDNLTFVFIFFFILPRKLSFSDSFE